MSHYVCSFVYGCLIITTWLWGLFLFSCTNSSFLYIAKYCSVVWMCWFVDHLSAYRQLGCFLILATYYK